MTRTITLLLSAVLFASSITTASGTSAPDAGHEPAGAPSSAGGTVQLAGEDRYHTSSLASGMTSRVGTPVVYIATGLDFPDALGAPPLDGPVLLVPEHTPLPSVVMQEIARLDPSRVVALGREAAVPEAVLREAARGREASRLGGTDRYDTAATIATHAARTGVEEILLARADVFADAVAATPTNRPVLLVPSSGRVPQQTIDAIEQLDPGRIIALGSNDAISDAVLRRASGGRDTLRLGGADRYATAVEVSRYFFRPGVAHATIATGAAFADALSASSLSAGPVLLVPSCGPLPEVVADELTRLRPRSLVVLGGEAAVCRRVVERSADAAGVQASPGYTYGHDAPADSEGEFRLAGTPWRERDMPVTYAFRSTSSDLAAGTAVAAVNDAFAAWDRISGITFKQVGRTDPANISITWSSTCSGCGAPGGTLAWGSVGRQAGNTARITFDEGDTWVRDANAARWGRVHLGTVAMHEIGHVMGIAHSQMREAVMWPYYKGPQNLHADDTAAAQALYGRTAPRPQPEPSPAPSPTPSPSPQPPPPSPSPPSADVDISKGGSAQGQPECSSSACRFINASGRGFAANRSVAVKCQENTGSGWQTFWSTSRTTDGAGRITYNNCYYGFPGYKVRVVIAGVASNVITW